MISVRFDNLEQVKQQFDPIVVEKAAFSAVKKLHAKAATQVGRAVRAKYNIKGSSINFALKKRVRMQGGVPSGFLIYTGKRISLRHFAVGGNTPRPGNQPRKSTARGKRKGARVRVTKTSGTHVVPGGFWGRARSGRGGNSGEYQIFQRVGSARVPIKKLTGPSVAHMVRGEAGIDEINRMMSADANRVFSHELDHFLQRQIGLR